MDHSHFENIIRSLANPSRRAIFSALTAALVGGTLELGVDDAEAKRKRGKSGKNSKRGKRDNHGKPGSRHDGKNDVQASGKKKKKKKKKKKPTMPTTAPPPPVAVSPRPPEPLPTECTTPNSCPAPPAAFLCAEATCVNDDCGFGPKPAGTVCRAAAGECDVAEVCDGDALDCPPNGFAATGKACRNPAGGRGTCQNGVCVPECTTPATCPAPPPSLPCAQARCVNGSCTGGPKGRDAVCRPVTGPCDFSELCDGVSLTCPANRFLSGVLCGPPPTCRDMFTAELQATCSGAGPTCPPFRPFVDCRPYTCGNGQCLSVCGNDDMCWASYCEGGVCKPKLLAGRFCTRHRQCTSSTCLGGFCCSSSSCFNQHGTATCAFGTGACTVTCDPGWGNCDGDTSTGCETNLDPDGPWTWIDQGDGTCTLACDPGWGNCDGDTSTGCETELNTNEHCGACGNTCPRIRCGPAHNSGSYECVNGTCECVIPEIDPGG